MKEKLLNRLAREAGIGFLSDLHSAKHAERVYDAVCRVSTQDYSMEEWREAAAYILGQQPGSFETAAEAALYLTDGLEVVLHIGLPD